MINALCGLKIPKEDAFKLVDAAQGETEAEIIASALQLHGRAKLPGQASKPNNAPDVLTPHVQQKNNNEPVQEKLICFRLSRKVHPLFLGSLWWHSMSGQATAK